MVSIRIPSCASHLVRFSRGILFRNDQYNIRLYYIVIDRYNETVAIWLWRNEHWHKRNVCNGTHSFRKRANTHVTQFYFLGPRPLVLYVFSLFVYIWIAKEIYIIYRAQSHSIVWQFPQKLRYLPRKYRFFIYLTHANRVEASISIRMVWFVCGALIFDGLAGTNWLTLRASRKNVTIT